MFSDIKIKVIELSEIYDNSGGGVVSNIKKGDAGKAISALPQTFRYFSIKIWKRILRVCAGRKYIEYCPPQSIGWSGSKYMEYIDNAWIKAKKTLLNNAWVYIHAYCGIIKDDEVNNIDFSAVKFREQYWERVNEILPEDKKCVGIHIRRTDHDTATRNSSTAAFMKKIEEIISKDKEVKFFLATDDAEEERELRAKYEDRIIVQPQKAWGRSNSDEMGSGIIDCLCLSRCEYILGSYSSVFSNFAARYGKRNLIICKDEENV